MTFDGHGAYYSTRILNWLTSGRIHSVSKTFIPAKARMYNAPGISVVQTVTFSEAFPTQMISDIMLNYEDGRVLDNGDEEFTVYDDVKWTVHLKENQ